jgi:hypothetical protein
MKLIWRLQSWTLTGRKVLKLWISLAWVKYTLNFYGKLYAQFVVNVELRNSRWESSGRVSPTLNNDLGADIRATSHTRLRACDHYISSTLIGGKRRSRSDFGSHYTWGSTGVCECQDGCKVYMDSYMASNKACFMVIWTILKIHLLEVGLTQDWDTMALWMLTTIDLFYCIMCEDPHE